jgi:hypothetical protein
MRVTFTFLVLLVVCLAGPAASQDVTGNLQGRVLEATDEPLPDVRITVFGASLQGERATTTDSRGYFRLLALPVGVYSVRLGQIGYRGVLYEEVLIELGKTSTLGEIRLERQTVELPELVASGAGVLIDPTTSSVTWNLRATTFEDLPIDRDWRSMVEILPNANVSFFGDAVNIGGSTGLENVWYVDGVNTTDPNRADGGTALPYNFVKEVEVKQAGYQAEYGRSLGGIVNAITYSGGNTFEAAAFGFFQGSALTGDPRFGLLDAQVDAFSTYDIGFRVGGPIKSDRLWFTAAYNPSSERMDVQLPGGVFQDRRTAHLFAGKLTWNLAPTADLTISVFGDPTTRDWVGNEFAALVGAPAALLNPDPFLGYRERGGVNIALLGHTALGQKAFLDASLALYEGRVVDRGATTRGRTEPFFREVATGTWSGGTGSTKNIQTSRTTARVAATLLLGSHSLKAGVEYEDNQIENFFEFTDPGFIDQVDDTTYTTLVFKQQYQANNRVPTLYLQDSWRASKRLTLNAGLRWESQYFVAAADSVGQAITGQVQPRLGVIYQLGRLGSQKLSASYGRFYQQVPLEQPGGHFSVFENAIGFYSTDPRDPASQPDAVLQFTPTDRPPGTKLPDIEGEHLDEFTLGYERSMGRHSKLVLRGIYRVLRAAYGLGLDLTRPPEEAFILGNIGEGPLDFLPQPEREYTAIEVTLQRAGHPKLNFLASYVLSRSHGNYTGLFLSDQGLALPNNNLSLTLPEQAPNSTGLLPNDRAHVLKLFGSYRFAGLTTGVFFNISSGTPLNEFGSSGFVARPVFLAQRGSAGRTPTLWDLNLRFAYDLGSRRSPMRGRIILDLLHLGNPREVVWADQFKFLGVDQQGNQILPNPSFGQALGYQPPMMARLGFEAGF